MISLITGIIIGIWMGGTTVLKYHPDMRYSWYDAITWKRFTAEYVEPSTKKPTKKVTKKKV